MVYVTTKKMSEQTNEIFEASIDIIKTEMNEIIEKVTKQIIQFPIDKRESQMRTWIETMSGFKNNLEEYLGE